ncbi:MAG: dUTP diphosphatase [bacterium]|nr:dUTP diphosphatase [bacterium]
MTAVPIRIARVRGLEDKDLALPELATSGSAGADLRAAIPGEQTLAPGQRATVPSGIAIALPEGFEAQVRPRSGLASKHGVSMLNAPGTIDSDYRGEISVILQNFGERDFVLRRGDRIAQLVVAPVVRPEWVEVDAVEDLGDTQRGDGGFGHTGR